LFLYKTILFGKIAKTLHQRVKFDCSSLYSIRQIKFLI